jgi:hypothetical protein
VSGSPAPLILGHNQFIGVDHLSQDKGREREARFADLERVADLIGQAVELGVTGLMVSTHGRVRDLLPLLERNEKIRGSLRMYPMIPYAQGYVRRANEVGLVRMVRESLERAGTGTKVALALRTARAFVARDPFPLLGALVDAELLPFRSFAVDAVILHNILTDLLLGWQSADTFRFFTRHVEQKHRTRAGFASMNYPLLLDCLEEWGLPRPLVFASFNPLGFQMNPSREACEQALATDRSDVVAMSVFAAGLVPPRDAAAYLRALGGIRSIVFGASTAEHVRETRDLLRFVEEGR